MTAQLYSIQSWNKLTTFRQISQRFLKMPKGQGAPGKLLGKQEMDVEYKAMASLAEAMEHSKLTKGEVTTEETPSQPLDGEHHHDKRFTIYFEVEKWQGMVPTPADRSVPAYVWTNEIIRDHVSRDIPEMTQLVVLSPSSCVAFKGNRLLGEGYMGDQALEIIGRLEGHWLLAGTEAMITACPITLVEAQHVLVKARDFIQKAENTEADWWSHRLYQRRRRRLPRPRNRNPDVGRYAEQTNTGLRSWNRGMLSTHMHSE